MGSNGPTNGWYYLLTPCSKCYVHIRTQLRIERRRFELRIPWLAVQGCNFLFSLLLVLKLLASRKLRRCSKRQNLAEESYYNRTLGNTYRPGSRDSRRRQWKFAGSKHLIYAYENGVRFYFIFKILKKRFMATFWLTIMVYYCNSKRII